MFTKEELNILFQLLDIATKAGGLQIAQQSLPLAAKIQELAKADDKSEQQVSVSE